MKRQVERLLKKLPGADPMLRGDPEPVTHRPSGARSAITLHRAASEHPLTGRQRLAVWARVLLGIALGAAITQWPYARPCGIPLFLYLAAVLAVLIAGAWACVHSWKSRMGLAHVVALLVMWWGTGLVAELVLPRLGYAATQATWRCPT